MLGFASMAAGLHHKTFQSLLNYTAFGSSVGDAIDMPDFFMPSLNPADGQTTAVFPKDRYNHAVLDATGLDWTECTAQDADLAGEGIWVAIERDPATGTLTAAAHNRSNSAAVAFQTPTAATLRSPAVWPIPRCAPRSPLPCAPTD